MKYTHLYCRFHQEINLLSDDRKSNSIDAALKQVSRNDSGHQEKLKENIKDLISRSEGERMDFFASLDSRLKDIASDRRVLKYFPRNKWRLHKSDLLGGELLISERHSGWHVDGSFGAWLSPDPSRNPELLRLHTYIWRRGGRSAALNLQTALSSIFPKGRFARKSLGWANECLILTSCTISKNKSATTLADEVASSFERLRAKEWKAIFEANKS